MIFHTGSIARRPPARTVRRESRIISIVQCLRKFYIAVRYRRVDERRVQGARHFQVSEKVHEVGHVLAEKLAAYVVRFEPYFGATTESRNPIYLCDKPINATGNVSRYHLYLGGIYNGYDPTTQPLDLGYYYITGTIQQNRK